MRGITLKGHGSFYIREGWITKGLMAVRENPSLFSRQCNGGADALGVGSAMAKAIRYWLRVAGLAETGKLSQLTGLGSLVLDRDPYLEQPGTLWMLHYNIASNREGAAVWNIFFNRFREERFTRAEMTEIIFRELCKELPAEEINRKSLESDCSVLLQMYLWADEEDPEEKRHSPLAELSLIGSRRDQYRRQMADVEKLPALLVYYGMCVCMSLSGNENRRSIGIEELLEGSNSPGRIFGLGRMALNDCLELLEQKGLIRVDRTAGLDVVYIADFAPRAARDILKQYYEDELRE